jgi:hypothetical protein
MHAAMALSRRDLKQMRHDEKITALQWFRAKQQNKTLQGYPATSRDATPATK